MNRMRGKLRSLSVVLLAVCLFVSTTDGAKELIHCLPAADNASISLQCTQDEQLSVYSLYYGKSVYNEGWCEKPDGSVSHCRDIHASDTEVLRQACNARSSCVWSQPTQDPTVELCDNWATGHTNHTIFVWIIYDCQTAGTVIQPTVDSTPNSTVWTNGTSLWIRSLDYPADVSSRAVSTSCIIGNTQHLALLQVHILDLSLNGYIFIADTCYFWRDPYVCPSDQSRESIDKWDGPELAGGTTGTRLNMTGRFWVQLEIAAVPNGPLEVECFFKMERPSIRPSTSAARNSTAPMISAPTTFPNFMSSTSFYPDVTPSTEAVIVVPLNGTGQANCSLGRCEQTTPGVNESSPTNITNTTMVTPAEANLSALDDETVVALLLLGIVVVITSTVIIILFTLWAKRRKGVDDTPDRKGQPNFTDTPVQSTSVPPAIPDIRVEMSQISHGVGSHQCQKPPEITVRNDDVRETDVMSQNTWNSRVQETKKIQRDSGEGTTVDMTLETGRCELAGGPGERKSVDHPVLGQYGGQYPLKPPSPRSGGSHNLMDGNSAIDNIQMGNKIENLSSISAEQMSRFDPPAKDTNRTGMSPSILKNTSTTQMKNPCNKSVRIVINDEADTNMILSRGVLNAKAGDCWNSNGDVVDGPHGNPSLTALPSSPPSTNDHTSGDENKSDVLLPDSDAQTDPDYAEIAGISQKQGSSKIQYDIDDYAVIGGSTPTNGQPPPVPTSPRGGRRTLSPGGDALTEGTVEYTTIETPTSQNQIPPPVPTSPRGGRRTVPQNDDPDTDVSQNKQCPIEDLYAKVSRRLSDGSELVENQLYHWHTKI